jgi:hypothetical protein
LAAAACGRRACTTAARRPRAADLKEQAIALMQAAGHTHIRDSSNESGSELSD